MSNKEDLVLEVSSRDDLKKEPGDSLTRFRERFRRTEANMELLDGILKTQIAKEDLKTFSERNLVPIKVNGSKSMNLSDDDDEEQFEKPSKGSVLRSFFLVNTFYVILTGVGVTLVLLGVSIRSDKESDDLNWESRKIYVSDIMFVTATWFLSPILVSLLLQGLTYCVEFFVLKCEYVASISWILRVHFLANSAFRQLARSLYLLLDVLSVAVLKGLLNSADQSDLCPSGTKTCFVSMIAASMATIMSVALMIFIWAFFRLLNRICTIYVSKHFNNRTHKELIAATLTHERILTLLLHTVPNPLLLPLVDAFSKEESVSPLVIAKASSYVVNHSVAGEIGDRHEKSFILYSRILGLKVFNRIYMNIHPDDTNQLESIYSRNSWESSKPEKNKKHLRVHKSEFLSYFEKELADLGLTGSQVWDRFLDPMGVGFLTMKQMITQVQKAFEHRKMMIVGMKDADQVIRSLDIGISFAFNIIVIMIAFSVFEMDVSSSWTTITSLVLSLTFVFGSSAANAFSAVVFLFAMTPYNVGDKVQIPLISPGNTLVVERIFLLTTVFRMWDGASFVISNNALNNTTIQNVTLSCQYTSMNYFIVDIKSFPPEIMEKYRIDIERFFKSNKALYTGVYGLTIRELTTELKFKACLVIEHNASMADIGTINAGKSDALALLASWFIRDGITFSNYLEITKPVETTRS